MVALAKEQGLKQVYVPAEDAAEASLIEGIDVLPVTTLRQLVMHLNGHPVGAGSIVPYVAEPPGEEEGNGHLAVDMSDIKGQEHVKRALEVAASGGHNCLMVGTPGAGKTLLAKCVPTILPSMSGDEMLEVTNILWRRRYFPSHWNDHSGWVRLACSNISTTSKFVVEKARLS
jgi:magnesium chelatase family protein